VILVDERGQVVDGDQLMAVVAKSWADTQRLSRQGIVATVMSNLGLERYLQSNGLDMARTPVGDRHVVEHMRKHGYNVGGEQSGHIVLSDFTTTGDGLVAALQVMAAVAETGQPVSTVCHRFEPLPQVLKNVRFKGASPLETDKIRTVIDSETQRLGNQGRVLIRKSGTEPVIRVMAEGENDLLVEEIVDTIVDAIERQSA
jgi:phosphoglucosamine mutase